jgi:ATP-dependent DNA helicase RecQ
LRTLQSSGFVAIETGTGLTNPAAPLASFVIDWLGLDRRQRADLSKLDTIQKYAYASTCRRAFVLRYFGDPAAQGATCCDGCDNCLGTQRVLNKDEPRPRKKRRQKKQKGEGTVVDPADAELFDRLRARRGEIAKRDRVPAYVVFADQTLVELATRRPRSMEAMASIRGVGAVKLEKYGREFLTLIRGAR